MKYFLTILLLIILLGCFFLWQGIYLPADRDSEEAVSFLIERGEGAKEISAKLGKQGLVRWGPLFRLYVLVKGVSGELKAGEYSLSKSMNIPEIVNKFVSGKAVKNEITIIEGWNLRDIGRYLEEKGIVQSKEFLELAGSPSQISLSEIWEDEGFDFLAPKLKNIGLEGYLFPDTYEILPGESIVEIIKKMLANFGKKLNQDLREKIVSQGKSIFEIVTMASLLEKEVKTPEDKEIVSGILWKRLENDIFLQVDATITYITGKKTTKISKEETQIDSPYNAYKYKGLPLGPISNPGLESIEAAIYPQDSEYWYYLSTPEGETIFSRTLEEHNEAKAEYLN